MDEMFHFAHEYSGHDLHHNPCNYISKWEAHISNGTQRYSQMSGIRNKAQMEAAKWLQIQLYLPINNWVI